MRSFNLSSGMVSITYTNHPTYGDISYAWSIKEFESTFNIDTTAYDVIIYEPDRNEYLIVEKDSTVIQTFNDPSENVAIQFIANHFDVALQYAIREHIRNTTDPYYQMTVDEIKEIKRNTLLGDLYLYTDQNYNSTIMATLSLVAQMPATATEVKLEILAIANWIVSVDKYYFASRTAINAAADVSEILNVTWDFSQFDATKPSTSLQSIFDQL